MLWKGRQNLSISDFCHSHSSSSGFHSKSHTLFLQALRHVFPNSSSRTSYETHKDQAARRLAQLKMLLPLFPLSGKAWPLSTNWKSVHLWTPSVMKPGHGVQCIYWIFTETNSGCEYSDVVGGVFQQWQWWQWVISNSTDFYKRRMQALIYHWQECITNCSFYVEK